jgi:integrase
MAKGRGAQGDGHIGFHKASGKFYAQITLGKKADGSRNRRTVYGDSQKDVRAKLQEIREEVKRDGGLREKNRSTLKDLIEAWLKVKKVLKKETTYRDYRVTYDYVLKPYIGDIGVEKVTTAWVKGLLAALRDEHEKSACQVKKAYIVLSGVFATGVEDGTLHHNPILRVPTPQYESGEQHFMTTEEQRCYIEAAKGHDRAALLLLALDTGARKSEILALEWRDIDWDSKTPRVVFNKNVVDVGGRKVKQSSTKTASGKRAVPISSTTIEALKALRKKNMGSTLVFAGNLSKSHLGQSYLHKFIWKPFLESAEISYFKFHSLRHTTASRWIMHGVPIHVIAKWLGHSSPATTMRFYGHLLVEQVNLGTDGFDALSKPIEKAEVVSLDEHREAAGQ